MNILILSAGTRNKIVQYFKEAVGDAGKVIATDCSNLAPAIYDADDFYLVPRITSPGYLECILDICNKNNIGGVFSLIDPELSLLAAKKEDFLAIGTVPVISKADIIETCFDKLAMFSLLKKMSIPTAKCYARKEDFYRDAAADKAGYPVFVKPVKGSASININKVMSREEIEVLFARYDDLMIQEYMDGQEYGADVYIDMISGKCTTIFLKKKLKMRAGETDKSVSVQNERLFNLIKNFVESCGFYGMIDIDIFHINGEYYISEVNPRFGGGYPHAHACGIDFPAQVINNLAGRENPVNIGDYHPGIAMMKYNEMKIFDINETGIIL